MLKRQEAKKSRSLDRDDRAMADFADKRICEKSGSPIDSRDFPCHAGSKFPCRTLLLGLVKNKCSRIQPVRPDEPTTPLRLEVREPARFQAQTASRVRASKRKWKQGKWRG
jgi:hypothetical protein